MAACFIQLDTLITAIYPFKRYRIETYDKILIIDDTLTTTHDNRTYFGSVCRSNRYGFEFY